MADNPYEPPPGVSAEPDPTSSVEFRRAHLGHEGAIRLFGLTLLIPTFFLILFHGAALVLGQSSNTLGGALMGLIVVGFLTWLGLGMYRLEPATHKPGLVLAVLILFLFPVGTAVGAYLLYLLATQKGAFIFSRGYQSLIAETPGLKAEAPLWIQILTALAIAAWALVLLSDLI